MVSIAQSSAQDVPVDYKGLWQAELAAPDRPVRLALAGISSLNVDGSVLAWQHVPGVIITGVFRSEADLIAGLETGLHADVLACSAQLWIQVADRLSSGVRVLVPPIVVTGRGDASELRAAIKHGASGYVPLSKSFADWVSAVRAAAAGFVFFPRSLLDIPNARRDEAWSEFEAKNAHVLSPREVEVARLVAQGLSDKQIAQHLRLSVRTIQGTVSSILAKLRVESRVELAFVVWTGDSQFQLTP